MSRKKIIMFAMIVGSVAGGYVPTLFGAGFFSFTSLVGSFAGGIIGIVLAVKFT